MSLIKIPSEEFEERVGRIRQWMAKAGLHAILVYGDEYRKENLRYVSNYWPIFERGALLITSSRVPILLCAPEGEQVAREMSVWDDIRLIPDFLCVTVPDTIEYPLAKYSSFQQLADEAGFSSGRMKLGLVGKDAMSVSLYETVQKAFCCDIVDCNQILYELRKIKSKNEIACIREAARIADKGMQAIMESNIIGLMEIEACGIAEAAARKEGAEHIIFSVFGSGNRTHTIVGRPTRKIIVEGDMIMLALAVQYEGYVATCEAPFAVGNYTEQTRHVIDTLIGASAAGLPYLKGGESMRHFVKAVKEHFRKAGLGEYDVYPPLHGIGCAEAESPYPDEHTEEVFMPGMTCNTDISLFGLPGGSNRIEEGFVITQNGSETLSPFVRSYCENWMKERGK